MTEHTEENQIIQYPQNHKSFFIMTPAMLDYLKITPEAYRLHDHYIRICGDRTDYTYSASTTAEYTSMTRKVIYRARNELEDAKLIYTNKHLLVTQNGVHSRETIKVQPRNIWTINSMFNDMLRTTREDKPTIQQMRGWLTAQLENGYRNPFDGDEPQEQQPDPWEIQPKLSQADPESDIKWNAYLNSFISTKEIEITTAVVMLENNWTEENSYTAQLDHHEQTLLLMWFAYASQLDLQNRAGYVRSRFESREPFPTNMHNGQAVSIVKEWITKYNKGE